MCNTGFFVLIRYQVSTGPANTGTDMICVQFFKTNKVKKIVI